jgi:hypothetical protein
MGGLGDNIYQRPLVRHFAEAGPVWLSTPYPEIYADLENVRPVRWATLDLRCQMKNMERQSADTWHLPPAAVRQVRLLYALRDMRSSISSELETHAGVRLPGLTMDLPDFGAPPLEAPYAVIRPATVRREWSNPARNPRPQYLNEAAKVLRRGGLKVVCVADIDGRREWLEGELPDADVYWIRGELDTTRLLALVQHASVVVGGVGWLVPAALADRVPAVIVGGGVGGHNAPEVLVDRRMDAGRMRFLLPDRYCRCRNNRHQCEKTIRDFPSRFSAALAEVTDA